jgi:3-oxoacyl-[acyl-carrier-protein] synthase III
MQHNEAYLAGIGTALGELVMAREAIAAGACTPGVARAMAQSAIRVAAPDISAVDLSVSAIGAAVRQANRYSEAPAHSFGPLLHAAIVRSDVLDTRLAARVHAAAQLPPTTGPVTAIRDGRNGVIWGLRSAATHLQSLDDDDATENFFVTAATIWPTPHCARWGPSDTMPLGDGAGAIIVSRRPARARLLSTAAAFEPRLRTMRDRGAPEHELHQATSALVQGVLETALADAGIVDRQLRWVITPFALESIPRLTYLASRTADYERVAPFTAYGQTTGQIGPVDVIVGLKLLGTSLAPIDDGDHVLLLTDDRTSAAAAVIQF